MNITYVNRVFLDYRASVLEALDKLSDGGLHVVYSSDATPQRVQSRLKAFLNERAIGLKGEWKWGPEDNLSTSNSMISLRFQPGIYGALKRTSPDVILAEGFFKWSVAAVALKLRHNIPLVICYEKTSHTERNAQWFRKLYRKWVVSIADSACCSGSLCRDYMALLGMPRERITMGHMAADIHGIRTSAQSVSVELSKEKRQALGIKGLFILSVCRLIPLKGLKELLMGWRRFEESYPEGATLVLVGDGSEKHGLETLCNQWSLRNVRFAGAVDYKDVPEYYAAADVFIIPTLEDNWSLVVPEAMSCGLPIMCSKYNGCWPELARQGVNGWVFDPYNPADIFDTLKSGLESSDLLKAMGLRSADIIRDYSPENAAESMLEACRIARSHK